jgi:hypothetical protein
LDENEIWSKAASLTDDGTMTTSESTTITIRLIRSFEHRAVKNLVLREVDLTQTVSELRQKILARLPSKTAFRKFHYDTLKIEHQAHGVKTNDPLINKNDDKSLVLEEEVTLSDSGVKNETTISFFKKDNYLSYKDNPTLLW